MRKLFICMALCLVAGCSSAPAETKKTVCTISQEGLGVETTFEHDGTKILKQISTNKIDLNLLGLNVEEYEGLAEMTSAAYNEIPGVTHEYKIEEGKVTETTTIDYTGVSLSELQELGIVEPGEVDYIGIEETLEAIAGSGFTCVEK